MATVFADTYGFNANDATAALQTALNDPVADKVLVRNMGTPWQIKSSIILQSRKEVVFEPGVIVQAVGNEFTQTDNPLFNATNIENVQLTGLGDGAQQATLKMDRPTASGENGHLITLRGVKNYRVSGLRLIGAGDDGLYIAGANFRKFPGVLSYSENGLIENVVADNNRRQGLSIISAKDLVVRNSKFINTNGINPGAGIDIEPNEPLERLQNIKIENVDLSNNRGNGLDLSLTKLDNSTLPISIDVNGARIDGNRKSGIDLSWSPDGRDGNAASSTYNGVITVRNTVISNTLGDVPLSGGGSGGIVVRGLSGDLSDPNNLRLNFDNVTITGTANSQPSVTNPIRVRGFGGATDIQQVGNLSLKDVVVRDNFDRDIFKADLGRNDGYLNNVSGNITAYNPIVVKANFDTTTPPQNFSLTVKDGKTSSPVTVNNPSFRDSSNGWSLWNNISVVDRPGEDKWVKVGAVGGGLGQDIANLVPGRSYTVSAVARLSQTGDQGTVGVLFKDAADKIIETKAFNVTSNTTQPSSVSFTAPSNFKTAQIFAWKSAGKADLFVDDFSLVPQA